MFTDQGLFGFDQTDNFDSIFVAVEDVFRHRGQGGLVVFLSNNIMHQQETLWRQQENIVKVETVNKINITY